VSLFLFQPSSAPGRIEGGAAPPPAPAASEGQAAPAGPPADTGFFGGPMGTLLLPMLIFIGFMFWQSRSQAKKQKELEESIKVGERRVTSSGIVGKVTEVGERTVRLEIAPGVHVTFLKGVVQGLDPSTAKADDKKDDAKDKAKDEPKKDK
jgi:preprotein translocase subunit YajC